MKKCTEKYTKQIVNQLNSLSLIYSPQFKTLHCLRNIQAAKYVASILEKIILSKDKKLNYFISAGTFDGNDATSKLTRQLFIELTGVTLPKSAKATRVKLEKYIATKSEVV